MITGTAFEEFRRLSRESPRAAAATIVACCMVVGFIAGLGGERPGSFVRGLVEAAIGLVVGIGLAVLFLRRMKRSQMPKSSSVPPSTGGVDNAATDSQSGED